MGIKQSKDLSPRGERMQSLSLYDDEDLDPVSRPNSNRTTLHQVHKMNKMESLDYRVADDDTQRIYYRTSNLKLKNAQKVVAKWFIYLLIGLIVGIVAWGIKKAIDFLQEFKYHTMEKYMEHNKFIAFFVYYSICALYALVGCVVVLICGPLAGGSGIPEVKGYLNGVRVEGTINIRSFIGKVLSIVFSYSSCLALGPEGPMVHIGSIVGGGLASGKSKTLHIRLPSMFEKLRTDKEQRDFISSGAAAGIAAAFGAPIGGVLFALEETSSFWSRELTWRTFFGCMVAAFTVNGLFKIGDTENHLFDDYGLLSFGLSRYYLYRYDELFAFALLGIFGGLLGSLFVKLNIMLNKWRRDKLRSSKWMGLIEVAICVTVFSVITFGVPAFGHCRNISDLSDHVSPNVCDQTSNSSFSFIQNYYCDEEHYNDFANLFLVPQDRALKNLFSRTGKMFSFPALIVFLVLYFAMVTVTAGIVNAGGLFVPMMLIGAAMGRIMGKVIGQIMFAHVKPPIDPSIYALVGSAAMMSGYSRTTISMVVIIVELTENTQFLLPIMLATMMAKWTGDAFTHSLYEALIELKSITFLAHHPPSSTYTYTIHDVMANDVRCVEETESLGRVIDLLQTTTHNGFPVVRNSGPDRQHTYRGMISRRQILVLLSLKKYRLKNAVGERETLVEHDTNVSMLNRKLKLDASLGLPPRDEVDDYVIDLSPYMDKSAPILQDGASYIDSYRMFQALGLRHLPVVDDSFQVVGMLTRHDLLHFYDSNRVMGEKFEL